MAKRKLNVAMIGYDFMGRAHSNAWRQVGRFFQDAPFDPVLKVVVGRARPVLPEPVAAAPGLSFPSGHALGATIGCCLFLLMGLRYLSRRGRIVAVIAAALIVCVVALSRVVLGVHFVTDVVAGIMLGSVWVAVTTWAYVAWRRETGQPVKRPADVGRAEQPAR